MYKRQNDYKSSARDIVEFYYLRGGKERIFDDMNLSLIHISMVTTASQDQVSISSGWKRKAKTMMDVTSASIRLTHSAISVSYTHLIDSTLGLRCTMFGYQYSEILRSLMCVYLCGGSSGEL